MVIFLVYMHMYIELSSLNTFQTDGQYSYIPWSKRSGSMSIEHHIQHTTNDMSILTPQFTLFVTTDTKLRYTLNEF